MFRSTIPACLLVQSQCTLKVLREPYRAPESLNLIFTGGKQDWISAFKETRLAPPFSLKRIKILLISNRRQWIIQKTQRNIIYTNGMESESISDKRIIKMLKYYLSSFKSSKIIDFLIVDYICIYIYILKNF